MIPFGIVIFDRHLKVKSANDQACRLVDLGENVEGQTEGQTWPTNVEKWMPLLKETIDSGKSRLLEDNLATA